MSNLSAGSFSAWAQIYRDRGFWPRRIMAGTKASKDIDWQVPDLHQPPERLKFWEEDGGGYGIGLLMGSPLPDGTKLGGVDIDRDDYVRLTRALLGDPPSGRIGAKGVVYFVRIRGNASYRYFKIRPAAGEPIKVGELLGDKRLCVLPPTIHPHANRPYRWIGTPLYEVNFNDLPLLEI